jgi:hypothetical protein
MGTDSNSVEVYTKTGLEQGICWLSDGYFCPEFILNPGDDPADWNYSTNTYIYTDYRPIGQ